MSTTTPNRGGAGSIYGGTQSPDPAAPDGYQKPEAGKDSENTDQSTGSDLGEEYEHESSYGKQEPDASTSAGDNGDEAATDAAGSGVQ